ncbi:MAG: phosphate transport regulator [Mucilaginibacter sp.]|jgi:predicted phosphate transport protein (TIGR00153 family)|nr:phosphate transport regulator [Mucilaginibacter sp.]MDB5138145.1 phosphate transport regulator [Mucilaginibacter sp.]
MSLNSIFQYFVPKDKKVFFPLFEQAASNVVAMATILVETVNSNSATTREELFKQIDKLENKGDEITHQVYLELGKNFITPFDREDIHSLASAIDDVADYIQGAANRMSLYRIDDFNEHIRKLSDLTLQASIDLEKAVRELKDLKNVRNIADSCIRINSVENQADYVFDRAVADLFLYEKDAIRLIKYKEIYSALETATDMCEDAANVMESILVKNA